MLRWRCLVSTCRKILSVREGSFFTKSRLTLQQWLILIHWWMREYPSGQAAEEAKVSAETAGQIYQWLREVCTTKLLATPIQLGGPGTVVQIDESLFRHKPKVRSNVIKVMHYAACMVHSLKRESNFFLRKRLKHTFSYCLQYHWGRATNHEVCTLPNTTVHSDQWQSYSRVQTLPNVSSYSTVNQSLTAFVDPATGVHTQNVELYWGRVSILFEWMYVARKVHQCRTIL